jgi:hypothetical protein
VAFRPEERTLLLRTPRLGPVAVARLEAVGIDTLERLAGIGVGRAIQLVGRDVRGSGWQNRRRALEQVLEEWRRSPGGAR